MASWAAPARAAMNDSSPRTSIKANADALGAADAGLVVPVWDLPVRLFHWTLVALIAFSWWSAENERVEWHLWSGYGVLSLLLFRLLWGLFGSSTARFTSFIRGPRAVVSYARDMRGWQGIGHTPLGALSVVALLGLTLVQVALGLVLSDEDGTITAPLNHLVSFDTAEQAHDLHELLFNVLLGFIGLHIAAILFYRLVLGKRLVGAMVTGRTRAEGSAQPMRPAKWWVALLCLIAGIAITRWIIAGAPPFGS
jgi:cytochrome b